MARKNRMEEITSYAEKVADTKPNLRKKLYERAIQEFQED